MSTPNKVSLSGKTRLTYREAYSLLQAANQGEAEIECQEEDSPDKCLLIPLSRAISKLKQAIGSAGGYDRDGNMHDPFERKQ